MPVLFLHCIDFNYHLGSTAFNQRTLILVFLVGWGGGNISKKVFLFLLIWECFILPSFLRDCFGYKNLDCLFFSFSTLNIWSHSILVLLVLMRRSVLILIGSLIYTMSFCSCCFEDFFLCLLAVLILCVSVWIWIIFFLDL